VLQPCTYLDIDNNYIQSNQLGKTSDVYKIVQTKLTKSSQTIHKWLEINVSLLMIVAAATSKDGFIPLQSERFDYHCSGRIMVITQCVVQAVCKGVKLEKAAASVALLRNSW